MKKTFLILAAMLCCIMLNAQQPAGDGSQANPYQITTADNLVWFAEHVNSGNTTACAILTEDITMNNNVLDTDGRPNDGPFTAWTPIGKPGTDFEGEFNGDGHTISGLYFYNTDENDVGVFGKAINNAYIHDLGVRDSYFYGGSWVGGICGDFASGRIENCWSGATVRAHGNDAGGICGSCWKYASVANCYNIGDVSLYQIKGQAIKIKFGGICGTVTYNENATSIDNCYTLKYRKIPHSGEDPYAGLPNVNLDCDKIYGVLDGDAEVHDSYVKDAAAFVGGEVCCRLNRGVTDGNQKWYQTLGSDLSPVMDNSHNTVYYGYDGDVLTYSNTQPDAPTHIVSYVDADGQEQTAVAVEITDGTSTLSAPWYVVSGSDVQTGSLTCNGAVHLILADGGKLTATGDDTSNTPGIQVSGQGNSLTIYGQTAQTGQLFANGGKYAAGIGGGNEGSGSNITINGGVVTANGGKYAAGIGGGDGGSSSNITINGGIVTATGGYDAAGIGGGDEGSGSDITINGGTVTANGGDFGAGIGGGNFGAGSNITINGGTVTANGGKKAAGIGGGYGGSGSDITINGGDVMAIGGEGAAGIGGGSVGSGYNITINGGTVTANAGANASCIGRGNVFQNYCSDIFVAVGLTIRADGNNPPLTVVAADRTAETDIAGALDGKRYATISIPQPGVVTYGDYITVNPEIASGARVDIGTEITFTAADRWAENYEFLGFYKESTFENKITQGVSGLTYTVTATEADISVYAKYKEFTPTPYIDADGQEQTANAAEITDETSTLKAGWYVVTGSDVQTGTLTCNGAVHLILADGAKLTATGGDNQAGINVSDWQHSLTIYVQSAQSGQLIANGGYYGAGIGGGKEQSGSNITINGGTVTATGGDSGAGIGGGWHGSGSNIIINGGNVIANGGDASGYGGAGIGGGNKGSGSNITINGGTVTTNGGTLAAGIGGGYEGSGSDIFVAAALSVYADNTNPPTTEISHTDNDIASHIAVFRYVTVKDVTTGIKEAAIAAINAAIIGVTNADIIAIATYAIDAINAAANPHEIEIIKAQALAAIASAKAIYASALGEMGVPCEDCPAVDVTKGTTTIRLYSPEKVEFKKME